MIGASRFTGAPGASTEAYKDSTDPQTTTLCSRKMSGFEFFHSMARRSCGGAEPPGDMPVSPCSFDRCFQVHRSTWCLNRSCQRPHRPSNHHSMTTSPTLTHTQLQAHQWEAPASLSLMVARSGLKSREIQRWGRDPPLQGTSSQCCIPASQNGKMPAQASRPVISGQRLALAAFIRQPALCIGAPHTIRLKSQCVHTPFPS